MLNGVADTTSGDLATVLNALDNLPTGSAVADAYQQISADKASALPALSLAGSMMQWRSLSNRLTNQRWRRGSTPPWPGMTSGPSSLLFLPDWKGLRLAYNWSDLGGLVSRAPAEPETRPWGIFTDFVGTLGSQDSSCQPDGLPF